ncbi:conserved Plasmodium protein, unknown function [Babesia microti strain RI]|uniref:RSE1/DDB1/CPSF1 C-terminal domain-containing protein n=1 Tax=Babesia microti (strain RI) TaxID=1133968 RepID=A0A1N6LY46_BABMR|nr:conserved Plasmodium protein, unknown function [Babesia microti strain RI]SIO73787.1 conserved Plasmodium protein, unknown function [Babesia microti strain RI]|eukprot:XP_021337848.1 conserved Plasmodium protein, unknown function [Babesia microti strain RI]
MVGVAVGSVARAAEADFLASGRFTAADCVELVLVYGTKLTLYRILSSAVVYVADTDLHAHPIAIATVPGCIALGTSKQPLDAITILFPGDRLVIASASAEGHFHQLLLSQIDSCKPAKDEKHESLHEDMMWNSNFSGASPLLSINLQGGGKKLYSILLAYPVNYLYVLTVEFGKFMEGDKSLNLKGSHLISNSDNGSTHKPILPLMVVDSIKFMVDGEGISEAEGDRAGPNVVIKSLIAVSDNVCAILVSNCPEKVGIHTPQGTSNVLFFSVSKVNGSLSLLSIRTGIPLDAFNLIPQGKDPQSACNDCSVIVQCHDRLIQVNPYTTNGFDVITSKFYLFRTNVTLGNSVLADLPVELELCHVEALTDHLIALLPLNSFAAPIILISLAINAEGKYICQGFNALARPPFYANIWHMICNYSTQLLVSSGAGMSIYIHTLDNFTATIEPSAPVIRDYTIPIDATVFDAQPTTISILTHAVQESMQTCDECRCLASAFISREIVAVPMLRGYLGKAFNNENKVQGRRKKRVQVRIAGGVGFDMARLRSKEADTGAFLAIFGPSGVAQPTNFAGKCHLIGILYTQIPLYLVARVDLPIETAQIINKCDCPRVLITSPGGSGSGSVVTIGNDIQISKHRDSHSPEHDEYICRIINKALTIYDGRTFEGVFHCHLNGSVLRHSDNFRYVPYVPYSERQDNHIQCNLLHIDDMDLGYTLIIAEPGFPLHVYRSNTGMEIGALTTFILKKFDCMALVPCVPITISQPLKLPNRPSVVTISATNYYLQLSVSHNDCHLHRIHLPQFPSLRFSDGTDNIFSEDYIPLKSPLLSQLHPISLGTTVAYLGIDEGGLSIFTLDTITRPITPFNDWISFKQSDFSVGHLETCADMPYQLWSNVDRVDNQLSFDGSVSFTKIATSIRCYYLTDGHRVSPEPAPGAVGKLWAVSMGKRCPISELLRGVLDDRAGEQIYHLHSEFGSKITATELLSRVEPHSLLLTQLELLSLGQSNDACEDYTCNISCDRYKICVGHLASQGVIYGYYELPPFTKVMSISFGIVGGREMLLVGTAQGLGEMIDCIGEFYILDLDRIFDPSDNLSTNSLELVHKRQFSGPVMSIKPAVGDLDWPNNPYNNFCLDVIEERDLGLDTSLGTVYLDEVTTEVLDKDSKSSIHAVVYSDQFFHSVGSRLFMHEISNGTFIRGAFCDMPFCVTDISMIDNFIVAGDVLKGVGLFMYRHFGASDTRAICRVASTNVSTTLPVLAVSATVCDDSLAIIAADSDSHLHLLSFSLEKARAAGPDTLVQDKITSSKLLTLSQVKLYRKILHFRRSSYNINYSFAADGSVVKVGIYTAHQIKLFKLLEEAVARFMDFPMGICVKPLDNLTAEDSLAVNVDTLRHFLYMPYQVKLRVVDKVGVKNVNIGKWTRLVSNLLQ